MTELETAQKRIAELESELAAMRAGGEPVAFMHDVPGRFDVIHAAVKKLLHDANDAAGHLLRPLDKSERYTIPLYTHPPAAQDAEQLNIDLLLRARAAIWQPTNAAVCEDLDEAIAAQQGDSNA